MGRASLTIVNRTHWNTEHLRAFVVAARSEVFGEHIQGKKLKVTFITSRRQGVSGLASVGGGWSRIRIPKQNIDKRSLAQILKHELSHNAGACGERWMRRSKNLGFRHPEWRETVEWADGMPLDLKPAEPKLSKVEKLERLLAHAEAGERAWRTRAKRAATGLRAWSQRVKRIQKRMAAALAETPGGAQ